MNRFMKLAVNTAENGIENGHGGPFGCVVVRDNKVLAIGHNTVLAECDPTAHGEIVTIREACKLLNTHDLSGCEIYTTGEPCTMCLCACLWANISKVYYACSIEDNASIGFRDELFDNMFGRDKIPEGLLEQIDRDEVFDTLFKKYNEMNKEIY